MSNDKQTAVDLMFQKAMLVLPMGSIDARQALKETYEEAKEMEKEQIFEAYDAGVNLEYCLDMSTPKEYYEKTYGGNK
jgi:hypothetical protein